MAQSELITDRILCDMAKQADQAMAFAALYQKQAEKLATLWVDRSIDAVQEGQAFAREWITLGTQVTADLAQAVEASVKDAARLFALPA